MSRLNVTLVETSGDAYNFINWLSERRNVLAIDTETSGTHWPTDRLRLVQFGDAQSAYAIPWKRWGGVVVEAFQKYDREIVFHNHKFDSHMFRNHGIKVPTTTRNCTMLMSHLDHPSRRHGLKNLASTFFPGLESFETDLKLKMAKHKWDWSNIPVTTEEYWAYGGVDTIITARLYDYFKPRVNKNLYDIEITSQFVIEEMERKGLKLDIGFLESVSSYLLSFIDNTRKWAYDEYGINIRKMDELQGKLLELGWQPTMYTPGGRISTSKKALENCDFPLAKAYTDYQQAVKFNSTFVQGLLDYEVDGIIYPNIHPTGAVTGRMSARDPNLQNLPRNSSIRGAFIAREDKKLIFVDYDLMEFVVFAYYAQDDAMIKAAKAEDTHSEMARRLFNSDKITSDQRQLAKSATYAILYGSGPETMANTSGLDYGYARKLHTTYKNTFTGIDILSEKINSEAIDVGGGMKEVFNINGRKLQNRDAWKLVNYIVQGTCADILKKSLASLWQTDLVDIIRLTVHDELVGECDDTEAEEVIREITKHMESAWENEPKLHASSSVYDRWGDKYK